MPVPGTGGLFTACPGPGGPGDVCSNCIGPCGGLCFVWQGTQASLHTLLSRVEAEIIEGPVTRHGGRRAEGTSVYTRDPDGNLIELIAYPD